MTSVIEALLLLGYTHKWIDYGFLSEEWLHAQSNDCHLTAHFDATEHYRYGSFIAWINAHADIQNPELEQFIELVIQDSDPAMAGSAVNYLLKKQILKLHQVVRLEALIPTMGPWLQKSIQRAKFIQNLIQNPDDISFIEQCLCLPDSAIHEHLLQHCSLTSQHLMTLAEKGANKSIRNRARQTLQSKNPVSK